MIIDVSAHQGNIDWNAVKSSGKVDGVIIRCGYGSDISKQDDSQFNRNANECIRLGIPFGVYLYSYATSMEQVDSEVRHTLRLITPYKGKLSLPVYFDTEEAGTQRISRNAAIRYCTAIQDAGFKAGIYCSLSWWKSYIVDIDSRFSRWIAAWGSNKPNVSNMAMWQYTDKGSVSGIKGNVDMSYCYMTDKLSYRTHVQTVGWMPWVSNGQTAGTTGRSLRMEAVQFSEESKITAEAHIQGIGDTLPVSAGQVCGTIGQSKRLEAVRLDAPYNIEYRLHVQGKGWLPWVKNGEWCGTKGEARRAEAIEVRKV